MSRWKRLSSTDPAIAFGWVAGTVGVLLVVLTPPFQVPDEPNHFFRAYQIAEGDLVAETLSTSVGGRLPRSFDRLTGAVMGNIAFHGEVKQDRDAWARAFEIPLLPEDRIETAFANTALSGPVAYLPQALGIEFGRLFGATALMVFYWGRLASVLSCVALTTLAILWLPVRRWTCALISLLPMTLFVRSSLSSDGPTLALTMLALAVCLAPVDPRTRTIMSRMRALLLGVTVLLAFGKPPYAAVVFLALGIPPRFFGGTKRYLATMLAMALVFVVAQSAWALALRDKTATWAPGADPRAQQTYVTDHPVDAAAFLVSDFVRRAPVFAHQAIGVLGWLDAPIPVPVAVFLGLTLVLVALGEPGSPPGFAGCRWLGVLVFAGGTLTLHALNYVWWTPPGSPFVAGIQGRHLLPFVPFLLTSIPAPPALARPLARLRPTFVLAFIVVSVSATVLTVIDRYHTDI
jgi:uncharacterized membrane protein